MIDEGVGREGEHKNAHQQKEWKQNAAQNKLNYLE